MVVASHLISVVAHQAIACAYPNIALLILSQCLYLLMRQALLTSDMLEKITVTHYRRKPRQQETKNQKTFICNSFYHSTKLHIFWIFHSSFTNNLHYYGHWFPIVSLPWMKVAVAICISRGCIFVCEKCEWNTIRNWPSWSVKREWWPHPARPFQRWSIGFFSDFVQTASIVGAVA